MKSEREGERGKVRCVLTPPPSHVWDPTIIDFVGTAIKME